MKTPKKPAPKTSAKAKKPVGRVFDVQRPGKAPAAPTSRPVIVGHKPQVQSSVARMSGVASREMLKPQPQKIAVFGLAEQGESQSEERTAPHRAPNLVPLSLHGAPKKIEAPKEGATTPATPKRSTIKIISPMQDQTDGAASEPAAAEAEASKAPAVPLKITRSDELTPEPAFKTPVVPLLSADTEQPTEEAGAKPAQADTEQASSPPVTPAPSVVTPSASSPATPEASAKPVALPALQPRPFPAPRVPEVPIEQFVAQPLPDSYTSDASKTKPESNQLLAAADRSAELSAPSSTPGEPQLGPIDLPEDHKTVAKDQRIIVSHHAGSSTAWKVTLLVVIILLLGAVAINILLDGGVLNWPLPHTDFLDA